jgi:hypothetical protein
MLNTTATGGSPGVNNQLSPGQHKNVKIVINREERVVNHLTKEVNNNLNLMFYDFNDYGGSVKNNGGPPTASGGARMAS